jgi:hypothetical protein
MSEDALRNFEMKYGELNPDTRGEFKYYIDRNSTLTGLAMNEGLVPENIQECIMNNQCKARNTGYTPNPLTEAQKVELDISQKGWGASTMNAGIKLAVLGTAFAGAYGVKLLDDYQKGQRYKYLLERNRDIPLSDLKPHEYKPEFMKRQLGPTRKEFPQPSVRISGREYPDVPPREIRKELEKEMLGGTYKQLTEGLEKVAVEKDKLEREQFEVDLADAFSVSGSDSKSTFNPQGNPSSQGGGLFPFPQQTPQGDKPESLTQTQSLVPYTGDSLEVRQAKARGRVGALSLVSTPPVILLGRRPVGEIKQEIQEGIASRADRAEMEERLDKTSDPPGVRGRFTKGGAIGKSVKQQKPPWKI